MLKRAMDVFYASVGTALAVVDPKDHVASWRVSFAAVAAASFYSLTGASRKAAQVTSSSEAARKLIQHAWGMVSLPSIKSVSLQLSRILKGAAVADRIEICGVSCFVLSSEPVPELVAAVKRFHRDYGTRRTCVSALSTIDENNEHVPQGADRASPFGQGRYRQRDIILHLTGGGFFAHIIASDLPFLLDWSAATGAVVICPEYRLLPETFPVALREILDVYSSLRCGSSVQSLGFETRRIVVTGESAGGNLAAALCVKLVTDKAINSLVHTGSRTSSLGIPDDGKTMSPDRSEDAIELPCALMLSCAALNLSLELSPSRVIGDADPVLPSGLLGAISDAYVPPSLGISKKDPLVSPAFASDAVLKAFPPTLLIASSNDPLLDDSVAFNQRLRNVGVKSELRAAQHLPHAYLGLGTAGFPEAQQVQLDCQEWLRHQFMAT